MGEPAQGTAFDRLPPSGFGRAPSYGIEHGNNGGLTADADDNGTVQLTDAVRILNVLFLGTGVIPPPGPPAEPCGSDSGGELGCQTYNGCG